MAITDPEQGLAAGDGLIDHTIELLAAVRAFGDAEALALIIHECLGRGFKDLQRQHGGAGTEIKDAITHELTPWFRCT